MKAAFYTRNGPAGEVIEIGEKPKPIPEAGEVLVELAFSGVNPSDVKSRAARPLAGAYQIPHSDGSGTVEAVGEGVDVSRIGERVWTWNAAWQRPDGTAAEYAALPADQAVKLPQGVSLEAAACLGIPGMTAAHAAELLSAETDARAVLVTGAGNAVGNLACQMAKQAGFTVIGTASARRRDLADKAGCDRVLDPYVDELAKAVLEANGGAPVDAIIDMDFSSTARLLGQGVLKPHGVLIGYGSNEMGQVSFDFRQALFNCHRLSFFVVYELLAKERKAAMDRLERALGAGLDIAIDAVLPLAEAARAHERVESGTATGNVLLRC
ncbi:NADPH:quinone reductase [Salaquimonas pukyongi]|uniref:NADPH:quinone reductase n=1 Tax=Salaquimonas pukyongi TaxID=2712698 RepID=UPI00096BAE57|nr:NADPH:quinone reductase [Salaquimonas pukyongi]